MSFKIEIRNNTEVWYQLPGRAWFQESAHSNPANAAARRDELQRAVDTPGNVVCLLLKKGVYVVFHSAMIAQGFRGRNMTAKGFDNAKEVFKRPAGPADALYFLTTARSKWTIYDSKKAILEDEKLFAPECAEMVKNALKL